MRKSVIRHGRCLENIQLFHWVLGKIRLIVPIPVKAELEKFPHYPLLVKRSFILRLTQRKQQDKSTNSCFPAGLAGDFKEFVNHSLEVAQCTAPSQAVEPWRRVLNGLSKAPIQLRYHRGAWAIIFPHWFAPTSLKLHRERKVFWGAITIFLICICRG